MEPTPELIDSIYLEKVERARQRPIGEKIFDGPRLFAYACEAARSGIRMQHPNASPEEVERLLRERLDLGRQLEMIDDE
jgi:hypothetical protein